VGEILSLLVGEFVDCCFYPEERLGCAWRLDLFKVFALNADALGPFVSLHVPPYRVGGDSRRGGAHRFVLAAYVPRACRRQTQHRRRRSDWFD